MDVVCDAGDLGVKIQMSGCWKTEWRSWSYVLYDEATGSQQLFRLRRFYEIVHTVQEDIIFKHNKNIN